VPTGDLIVFSTEADQVVAVDAITGKFKWQFKGETPEEYTLRGHAGVWIDNDLVFTGFSNGTLVALRKDTGSVAWSTSLKGDADRFMDVDATPVVVGEQVFASSSSGGVNALDKTTGLIRWRVPFYDVAQPSSTGNVGGIATDGKTLYVSVADLGTYAIDLAGNVLWRVGAKDGGEPAVPVIWNELLLYSLTRDGMFIADRRTGEILEYFDPGEGTSSAPTVTADGRLFVMSNRGNLYAFDLE
jgi:outer membrane protein assembly factor BamB